MRRFSVTAVLAMLVNLLAWTPSEAAQAPNPDVLRLALKAIECGVASGDLQAPPTLTLIDYSLPSTTPRLWVFDLRTGKILFNELVAHGRNTGENIATSFSDAMNSHQSSLGLFVTGDTYIGSNGYSLRLDGLEPGFNLHAYDRAIVMHGAPYVSEGFIKKVGRIGRSWGCPAVRPEIAHALIDTLKGGQYVFAYYPDAAWLAKSAYLHCDDKSQPEPQLYLVDVEKWLAVAGP